MSESDEIRDEIRETRERMSDTLDQLGTRLNPNRIKAEVRDNIREATIGRVENMARQAGERAVETRDGILNTIRDNPIPAAMIGIGLGWMLFGGRRRSGHMHDHSSHSHHIHSQPGYVGDVSATTPRLQQDDAAGGMGASISHDGNGVVDRVRDRVSGIGNRLSDVGSSVGERFSGVGSSVGDRVSGLTEHVSDVRYRVTDRVSDLQDTPLALGAVALAAGLAAGFAVPVTDRESELMGAHRDRLMDRAREAASDVKERAMDVASRVYSETKENVTETVKTVAREEGISNSSSSASGDTGSSTTFGSSTGNV